MTRKLARSETPSLLSYILRCVSFTEVGTVCRVVFREPMYLCTSVNEELVDGEDVSLFYFIMNQEIESYRQDSYMRIGVKD